MLEWKKTTAVAGFELSEALRSRFVLLLSLLSGLGSFIASSIFLNLLSSAEELATDTLANQTNADTEALSAQLTQDNLMPWIASMISDPGTREQVASMDPLSVFFGFAALQTVAGFVLLSSTATIPKDLVSGAARFTLLRCERLSWVAGKALGQTILLAGGLLLAAAAATAASVWVDRTLDVDRVLWLFRMSFRAWLYGFAHLGLFMGLSMFTRAVMHARVLSFAALMLMSLAHAVLTSGVLNEKLPGIDTLAWVIPAHHQGQLWSSSVLPYAMSVLTLLAIGLTALYAGYAAFQRRDA